MLNKELVTKAQAYLTERGYKGGLVLFYQGKQYGWKNALRNPEAEKPGAIAIDSEGNQYQAVGGCEYHGATHWQQIWPQAEQHKKESV